MGSVEAKGAFGDATLAGDWLEAALLVMVGIVSDLCPNTKVLSSPKPAFGSGTFGADLDADLLEDEDPHALRGAVIGCGFSTIQSSPKPAARSGTFGAERCNLTGVLFIAWEDLVLNKEKSKKSFVKTPIGVFNLNAATKDVEAVEPEHTRFSFLPAQHVALHSLPA